MIWSYNPLSMHEVRRLQLRFLYLWCRAGEVIFSQALAHARQETISSFPSHELMMLVVKARRNLALYQHHDGITGTAKDFVVVDYGQRYAQRKTTSCI